MLKFYFLSFFFPDVTRKFAAQLANKQQRKPEVFSLTRVVYFVVSILARCINDIERLCA